VNPIMEPEDAHSMEFVREFMLRFGQAVPPTVSMPDPETHNLRWRLIDEEAQELRDATSLVQYLDAVGDLLYVVYGAAISAGFTAHQIESAVYEIHRSNMSKLWSADEIECIPGGCFSSHAGDGRYIVRRNDGKVIKSPSYSPANLQPIIE
jgi:predicted HAD superfamily Cof-like phosphohydrolase